MCLLDEVVEWGAGHIRCRSTTHRALDTMVEIATIARRIATALMRDYFQYIVFSERAVRIRT